MTAERSNRIGAINSEPFSAVMACRRLRPGLRLRASLRGTIVADGSLRANRALLVAHGPPRTRVPEGRSKIGRRFSAGFLRFQIGPVPEGRGERCEQKMIRVAVFAEKTDVFLLEATPSPRPCGTGFFLVYWNTGAEAPAYYQSASPRRRNVGRASSPVASPK